jgi:hypothetical protein
MTPSAPVATLWCAQCVCVDGRAAPHTPFTCRCGHALAEHNLGTPRPAVVAAAASATMAVAAAAVAAPAAAPTLQAAWVGNVVGGWLTQKTVFSATWRVRNTGSDAWFPHTVYLSFVDGTAFCRGAVRVALTKDVLPGEEVDFVLPGLVVPPPAALHGSMATRSGAAKGQVQASAQPRHYVGVWRLHQSETGVAFGDPLVASVVFKTGHVNDAAVARLPVPNLPAPYANSGGTHMRDVCNNRPVLFRCTCFVCLGCLQSAGVVWHS